MMHGEEGPEETHREDCGDEGLATVMNHLSKSLQTMAGSMKAMEGSLKRLHFAPPTHPNPKKKPKTKEATSDSSIDDSVALCGPTINADSAEGQNDARLEQPNDNDSLLLDIENDFSQQEDTGPAIAQKLADIINKRWSEKLSDQKLREKREKYPRPTNCEQVVVPRMNPEIWSRVDHTAKQLDLKSSAIQTNLVKVVAIWALLTDKLLSKVKTDPTSEMKDLVTFGTDALALLGHASSELSQRRRETLKPHLSPYQTRTQVIAGF